MFIRRIILLVDAVASDAARAAAGRSTFIVAARHWSHAILTKRRRSTRPAAGPNTGLHQRRLPSSGEKFTMSDTSKRVRPAGVATTLVLCLGLSSTVLAEVPVAEAQDTVAVFKKADPGIEGFLKSATGYVVFPTVTKGAFVVGGAGGSGVLFENGKPVGKTSLGQATIGLQAGGQAYSEIIFFENAATLSDFKKGNFGLAAQVSAVALSAGAAATAKYESGVAVFTATKTGLMVEASVGGQWFHYEPFPDCPSSCAPAATPTAPVGVRARACDTRALPVVADEGAALVNCHTLEQSMRGGCVVGLAR